MAKENKPDKEFADSKKYYELFADKVGKFKPGDKILFIHIGNFDVLNGFIENNPECSYFIIDSDVNENWFKMNWDCEFIGTNEDESIIEAIEKLDMKFDKIIMNPPYSKNLNLKILAKAIEKLDEDGTCVNLIPIMWLQDPLSILEYKKSTDFKRFKKIVDKTVNISQLTVKDSLDIFNAQTNVKLGIYEIKSNAANQTSYLSLYASRILNILKKVCSKMTDNFDNHTDYNKKDGWRVRLNQIKGGFDHHVLHPIFKWVFFNGKQDGKDWTEFIGCRNGYSAKPGDPIKSSIKCDSETEAVNFEASCKTNFMHFLHSQFKNDINFPGGWLPFMSSYKEPWTDERFFEYFGITKDEQEIIYKTVKSLPKYLEK